ncbi:antitermination protein [Serratia marcescens]|nr:antitermination protein [Serratia marcescens]
MNQQYIEYVRGELSVALADIQRSGKGQLAAFEENSLGDTTRLKRKRLRSVELDGRKVCRAVDPMHCPETRVNKKPMPPLDELTYITASWRRAVAMLENHERAWIRYCYANDLDFNGQVAICRYIWELMQESFAGKRITKKVCKRLESLVWLAVQQAAHNRGAVIGREYSHTQLAELSGVNKATWSEIYSGHWQTLISLVETLDAGSLQCTAKKRIATRSKLLAS